MLSVPWRRLGAPVCWSEHPGILECLESFEVCHGDGYISAWCLEYLLVTHHVERVIEVVWDQLPLFLVRPSLSVIGVALFALLSLFIGLSVED